jgi:alginate O-acetyltransferase complex protein AlgI
MDLVTAVLTPGRVHYLLCTLLVCVAAGARRSTKTRQLALLLASWLFYVGWGAGFLSVLIVSSLMNYLIGAALKRHVTGGRLWVGVVMNVALLGFFKYGTALLAGEPGLGFVQQLVRPIGISFWTLQALSYLFDIYREEELDPSLLEFCLYMAFWPTVLTGPICRLPSLLPQFRRPISPSRHDLSVGVSRVLQGLFMKMFLAEILGAGWRPGAGVNAGFDRINGAWGGLDVWFLAIGFGAQLFFDFAGYSHIVIGAARLIGIRLEENFDRPYLSPTPAAFWTRWHMSLSFWIRDYVFLLLASMRRGRWWVYSSLLLSMVVCGVWHGATATFIVWGAYHGFLLVSHRIGQQVKRSLPYRWPPKLGRALSWASTFCLVSVGWLFFRAPTVTQAMKMSRAIFAPGSYGELSLPRPFYAVTSAIVVGWILYHAAEVLLARWRAAYEEEERDRIRSEPMTVTRLAQKPVSLNSVAIELTDFGAARKWWCLAPLMIVVALFAGLAISDLKPASPRTPFMYTLF